MMESEVELLRKVAKEIADHRKEVMDKIRTDIEKDLAEFEAKGLDPTRGRGRGPLWAEGD